MLTLRSYFERSSRLGTRQSVGISLHTYRSRRKLSSARTQKRNLQLSTLQQTTRRSLSISSATAPIVVVTGSNTGVGFETVRALVVADQPYTVILCSRDLKKGQDAALKLRDQVKPGSQVVPLQLDITDDNSIEHFVKDVEQRFGRVDILINNAGVSYDMQLSEGTMSPREVWNGAYNTNVTSTHILTNALMPLLFAAASSPVQTRILFVSSGVGSDAWHTSVSEAPINWPQPAGWPKPPSFSATAYRSSKSGMNMMFRECLVATNLGGSTPESARQMGAEEPDLAGRFFVDVVEGKYDEFTGLEGKLISQGTRGQPIEW